jgi:hypothetical protein
MIPDLSRLNRMIDGVARQMTAVDPSPGCHARVLRRLDDTRPHTPWALLLAGATCALAVAALTFHQVVAPGVPDLPPVTSPGAMVATVPPAPSGTGPEMAAPRRPGRAGARAQLALVEAVDLTWHERALPALPRPVPLSVEAIQPDPLTIPLLQVIPVGPDPLALPPIGEAGS